MKALLGGDLWAVAVGDIPKLTPAGRDGDRERDWDCRGGGGRDRDRDRGGGAGGAVAAGGPGGSRLQRGGGTSLSTRSSWTTAVRWPSLYSQVSVRLPFSSKVMRRRCG